MKFYGFVFHLCPFEQDERLGNDEDEPENEKPSEIVV